MVVDTEPHVNEHSAGSGKPREKPGAMEGTLRQCVDGSILFGEKSGVKQRIIPASWFID
jgi:hypothetical protein